MNKKLYFVLFIMLIPILSLGNAKDSLRKSSWGVKIFTSYSKTLHKNWYPWIIPDESALNGPMISVIKRDRNTNFHELQLNEIKIRSKVKQELGQYNIYPGIYKENEFSLKIRYMYAFVFLKKKRIRPYVGVASTFFFWKHRLDYPSVEYLTRVFYIQPSIVPGLTIHYRKIFFDLNIYYGFWNVENYCFEMNHKYYATNSWELNQCQGHINIYNLFTRQYIFSNRYQPININVGMGINF